MASFLHLLMLSRQKAVQLYHARAQWLTENLSHGKSTPRFFFAEAQRTWGQSAEKVLTQKDIRLSNFRIADGTSTFRRPKDIVFIFYSNASGWKCCCMTDESGFVGVGSRSHGWVGREEWPTMLTCFERKVFNFIFWAAASMSVIIMFFNNKMSV